MYVTAVYMYGNNQMSRVRFFLQNALELAESRPEMYETKIFLVQQSLSPSCEVSPQIQHAFSDAPSSACGPSMCCYVSTAPDTLYTFLLGNI